MVAKKLRARKSPRPATATLSESIGFLLNKAAQFIRERFESCLVARGLTAPQVGILSVVASRGSLTQREIGDVLRIDRTTMVQLIDRLEDLKLIARGDHATDRRSYAVGITAKGQAVLKSAMADATRIENEILHDLSERDRQILRRVLRAIPESGGQK